MQYSMQYSTYYAVYTLYDTQYNVIVMIVYSTVCSAVTLGQCTVQYCLHILGVYCIQYCTVMHYKQYTVLSACCTVLYFIHYSVEYNTVYGTVLYRVGLLFCTVYDTVL